MPKFPSSDHQRINPLEQAAMFWPDANLDHITYEPKLRKGDFEIVRGSSHDGTLAFTWGNWQDLLLPVVNTSKKVRVGPMRWAVVFHPTRMHERTRMAVVIESWFTEGHQR